MYSIHHEGKSVVAERFIRTLKNKIYKYMTSISKNVYGTFYEKELKKTDQQEFRIEKVIERKGDKLYVKWKGYDN